MTRRFLGGAAAALVAITMTLVGGSTSAQAAPSPWCSSAVGSTVKQGTTIWGSGTLRCTTQAAYAYISVTVQEEAGVLGWRNRHTESRSCSGCTPNWNFSSGASCAGHGRDKWRTKVYARFDGGIPKHTYTTNLYSAAIWATC